MKRLGNCWEQVLEPDNGFVAVWEGTLNKRHDKKTQRFFFDPEDVEQNPSCWHAIDPRKARAYTAKLAEKLRDGTWIPKAPRHIHRFCHNKTSKKGKWRDLYVPAFDDHIVAHMIMQVIMPAFTRGMHPHCCGSVPRRGINHIVRTVSHWAQDDRECRYFVKLDIRKFFDSIQADILIRKLNEKIKDKYILQALEKLIRSAPSACPVGYYTSPFFANLYLQDLDWFIEQHLYKERRGKRIKWVRHYLRYMDDMLLIGTSKADLYKAVRCIQKYLKENYQLEIKPTWEIKRIGKHEQGLKEWKLQKGTYWIDIGGYKFCKDSTIMRAGIFLATRRLAKKIFRSDYYKQHDCRSINSRLGWAKHCDSQRFIEREIKPYVDIKRSRRACGKHL